jgi:hypothetical protein
VSADIVDDLHAAEDYGSTLRGRAKAVVAAWGEVTSHADGSANQAFALGTLGVAVRELNAVAYPFERPGCESEDPSHGTDAACIEGEDCGGYHPWQEET